MIASSLLAPRAKLNRSLGLVAGNSHDVDGRNQAEVKLKFFYIAVPGLSFKYESLDRKGTELESFLGMYGLKWAFCSSFCCVPVSVLLGMQGQCTETL